MSYIIAAGSAGWILPHSHIRPPCSTRHLWTPPRFRHVDPQFWTSPAAMCLVRMVLRCFEHILWSWFSNFGNLHVLIRSVMLCHNASGVSGWTVGMFGIVEGSLCQIECPNTKTKWFIMGLGLPARLKIAAQQKQWFLWWHALDDGRKTRDVREEHGHLPAVEI